MPLRILLFSIGTQRNFQNVKTIFSYIYYDTIHIMPRYTRVELKVSNNNIILYENLITKNPISIY